MIAFKLIAFIVIFQGTLCWNHFYHGTNDIDDYNSHVKLPVSTSAMSPDLCPEDESMWTRNDIIDIIHYVKLKLNIADGIDPIYYKQAEELRVEYANKLKEFIIGFEDRPHHAMHILEIIAETRQSLEPRVNDIIVKLQEFEAHEEQFNDISDHANNTFDLLNKYKEICQINCEETEVKTRLKIKATQNYLSLRSSDSKTSYCYKLRQLYGAVYEKLSQYKGDQEKFFRYALEHEDEIYNERFESLTSKLKTIAIVKFSTTMYNLLSLQDDYYNFGKYVNNINGTMKLEKIKTNNLDIEQKLNDLEMEVEKYRKYCTNCGKKQKVRQGIPVTWRRSYPTSAPDQTRPAPDFDILDELIYSAFTDKLNEDGNYQNNMRMFEELEVMLQNEDAINTYVEDLTPIQQKITNEIENEERELDALKNQIAQVSISRISELLHKSQELLDKLVSTKEYINQFI